MARVNVRFGQKFRISMDKLKMEDVELERTLLKARMGIEVEERATSRLDDMRFLRTDDDVEEEDVANT